MKRLASLSLLLLGACSSLAHAPREPSSLVSCFAEMRGVLGPSRATHSPLLFDLAEAPFVDETWKAWLWRERREPDLRRLADARVNFSMSSEEKFAAIAGLELAQVVAKPGHMVTRAPDNILFFAKDDPFLQKVRVKKKPGQPDKVDRAVLNIVTDDEGRPVAVDAWDGHHRLLGAMLAWQQSGQTRAMTLGDLHADAFDIHVNGRNSEGRLLKTTPPAAGVDFQAASKWAPWEGRPYISPTRAEARFADIWMNGGVSNWDQGSRFTLEDLLVTNLQSPFHTVGVVKGQKGWSLDIAKARAFEQLGVKEILITATASSRASDIARARELNRVFAKQGLAVRVNVWIGDFAAYVERYQEDSFLRRVQETYITRAPPRYLDLERGVFEDTKPLGYDAPVRAQ
jgi:hypothetical protein